ncbi:HAD family hydrolase [Streptomyces fructofermentans]|uniref:HAD family hydrolase n=1 Tax=Streptomyces fructofermentans TaxID=152141 RepID=UPI0037BD2E2A
MTPILRATVFDLDDTLLDTQHLWPEACAAFTARHGHRWRTEDTRALHGNGAWASYVAALCPGSIGPDEVTEACTTAMVDAVGAGRVHALPGAVSLVLEAARHGMVGVATASPRRFVHAALDRLGLTARLHTVVCGEHVTRPKPAPDAYRRAASELDVPPSDCLAVEDSPNGIRSARAAGMSVLAIARDGTTLPADIARLTTAQARDATRALPTLTRLLSPHSAPHVAPTPASPKPSPASPIPRTSLPRATPAPGSSGTTRSAPR